MPGITLNPSRHNQWSDSFRKYAQWNEREGADLFVAQTLKLAYELEAQTAAIAPSKAEISADVKAQGWKIPRKFADGRLGRGVPQQWLGWALAKREKRRGRKTAGQSAGDDAFMRGRGTLAQMQRFVMDMRAKARKYLSSGWLGAIIDLGGSVNASSGKVDRARGGAEIRREPGRVSIVLWNRTPGIETMDAKKQFVAKAIAVRTADMWIYIRRKMNEAAGQYFRAAA